MKYVVNDGCIGCGLCEGTCPEVFSTDARLVPLKKRKEVGYVYFKGKI